MATPRNALEDDRYGRWRNAYDGFVYRSLHAPAVPTILSERLLAGGPVATVNWYPRRLQVVSSAQGPTRDAVVRWRARLAVERAERQARIDAITGNAPVEAPDLLMPSRELVLPGAGALEVADFAKPPTRGA